METSRHDRAMTPAHGPPHTAHRHETILAVGLTATQLAQMPSRLFGALGKAAVLADYGSLTRDKLRSTIAVLSPLTGVGFDAIDIAMLLDAADYNGHYFAFTQGLPNPDIVLREVAAVAPDLSFEVVEVGAVPHLVR